MNELTKMNNCTNYTAFNSTGNGSCSNQKWTPSGETNGTIQAYTVFSIAFCIIVLVIGVSGNSFVIITFTNRWSRLKTCEIFMVGLAIADLIGTISVPLNLIIELQGFNFRPIGNTGCAFIAWLNVTSVTVSAFSLVAIAIDRFVIVLWPLKARLRQWKAFVVAVAIWILASPLGMVYFFGGRNKLYQIGDQSVCRTFWTSVTEDYVATTATFIIQMVIPILLMTGLYTAIARELRTSKAAKLSENCARVADIRNRRNKKAIRLFLTIVCLFYVLVLPYNIFFLIYTFQHFPYSMTIFYTNALLNLIHMLNSCVNPIIYARLHTSFRRSALRILFACCVKRFAQYDWNTMSISRRLSLRSRYLSRHSPSPSPKASPINRRFSNYSNQQRPSSGFLSPSPSTRISALSPSPKHLVVRGSPNQRRSVHVGYITKEETVRFFDGPTSPSELSSERRLIATSGDPPTPTSSKYVRFVNQSPVPKSRPFSSPSLQVKTAWMEKQGNGIVASNETSTTNESQRIDSTKSSLLDTMDEVSCNEHLESPKSILKITGGEEENLMKLENV